MTITFPDTTDIIDQIRNAIGREVIFQTVDTTTECPVCGYNHITESATDPFCPTCSGLGYIPIYTNTTISGHITWGHSEQLGWLTGGQIFEGDCRVQIKYTAENITVVDNTKSVIVDGKTMQIDRKILRGAKELNRIILILKENE